MNVLWLTHPECDYSAYFLYNGLRQLGVEVVDYPYKSIYHGESCSYPIPWYGEDKMGHSSPVRFFRKWSGERFSEDEVVGMMRRFDFVVLESPRPIAVQSLERLEKRCSLPPLVFVDGEDYDYIHKELIEKFVVEVTFKRELSFNSKNVFPFPFSSYVVGDERYQFKDDEKELDVFCVLGFTHPQREKVCKELRRVVKKHGYEAIVGLDHEPVPPSTVIDHTYRFEKSGVRFGLEDYLRLTAKAKIAVSVRGYGRDTIRMWEIPSYETLMLSDDLYAEGLIHPHPFTHQRNAVFFKPDCSDLEELLVYYLEKEDERVKVAQAGRQHLVAHHTNQARATYFLERVKAVC